MSAARLPVGARTVARQGEGSPVSSVLDWPLHGVQLVEASAGTGKTWTLCALFLRLVLEARRGVEEILVVTFTQAATAELSTRIRDRLVQARAAASVRALEGRASGDAFLDALLDRVAAAGESLQAAAQRLDLALRTFDEARIHTIHGFCQRALAEAPFAAGLPMDAPQVGEDDAVALEVVEDFWRRHIAFGSLAPALVAYLRAEGDSPERWAPWLQACAGKPLARRIWPDAVGQASGASALAPGSHDLWGLSAGVERATDALHDALQRLRAAWRANPEALERAWAHIQPQLKGNIYRPGRAERTWAAWAEVLEAGLEPDWGREETLKALAHMGWLRLSESTKKDARLGEHPVFRGVDEVLDLARGRNACLQTARLALLHALLSEGEGELLRRKRDRRLLAYDDMLSNLHRALHQEGGTTLLARLRQSYPVALVDEFQDTDPQQYDIFERIYAPAERPTEPAPAPLLFLVGDPKQAIYGFRNADLPTYLRARAKADATRRLDENQRSAAALLHAQNALFGHREEAFAQEGLVHAPVRLGAKPRVRLSWPKGAPAALQLWELAPAPEDIAQVARPTRAQGQEMSLAACAADISALLASGAQVGERPLKGGDVAVLVRRHQDGRRVRKALAERGVFSVERSRESVWASLEADQLLTLLQAVARPQTVALVRTALATPLMAFDAQALVQLDVDPDRQAQLMGRFAQWHQVWHSRGVGVMLREVQAFAPGLQDWLQGLEGDRRWTNWRHLGELLQQHEGQSRASPDFLLQWMRTQMDAGGGGDAAQLRLESDADRVQIVTIHASKGLEYPVVYLPLLWPGLGTRGGRRAPWVERLEEGETVLDFHPDAAQTHAQELREQAHAEAMRLLYVALTRAVHRCVLVVGSYRATARAPMWSDCTQAPLNAWLLQPADGKEDSALAVDRAWQQWADQTQSDWLAAGGDPSCPAVDWCRLPLRPPPASGAPPSQEPPVLAALTAARVREGWRLSSYSALMGAAPAEEEAARDHDARTKPAAQEAEQDEAFSPLLSFPRGARAGECIHAVFENAAFGDSSQWLSAVDTALAAHEAVWDRQRDTAVEPVEAPMEGGPRALLLGMLRDVLHTPLPQVGPLAALPPTAMRAEWEFHLAAPRLNPASLASTLRAQGWDVPELNAQDWGGYLRGFVDLVFYAEGRWHLLDWKSNHLGARPQDYAPASLERAMQASGYTLQAALYALALHRYLRLRVRGYEAPRHLGQVYYLFVRGMGPTRLDGSGAPLGVHVMRPDLRLLDAMDQALGGCEAGEGLRDE